MRASMLPNRRCRRSYRWLAADTLYRDRLGYGLRIREPDWYEHRMFNGPDTAVNVHVFSSGCPEVDRMLLRNWLRTHLSDRDLYARTKRHLATTSWLSVQHHADAKTAIIEEILTRARHATFRSA